MQEILCKCFVFENANLFYAKVSSAHSDQTEPISTEAFGFLLLYWIRWNALIRNTKSVQAILDSQEMILFLCEKMKSAMVMMRRLVYLNFQHIVLDGLFSNLGTSVASRWNSENFNPHEKKCCFGFQCHMFCLCQFGHWFKSSLNLLKHSYPSLIPCKSNS